MHTLSHVCHNGLLCQEFLFAVEQRDRRPVVGLHDVVHLAVVIRDFGVIASPLVETCCLVHLFARMRCCLKALSSCNSEYRIFRWFKFKSVVAHRAPLCFSFEDLFCRPIDYFVNGLFGEVLLHLLFTPEGRHGVEELHLRRLLVVLARGGQRAYGAPAYLPTYHFDLTACLRLCKMLLMLDGLFGSVNDLGKLFIVNDSIKAFSWLVASVCHTVTVNQIRRRFEDVKLLTMIRYVRSIHFGFTWLFWEFNFSVVGVHNWFVEFRAGIFGRCWCFINYHFFFCFNIFGFSNALMWFLFW